MNIFDHRYHVYLMACKDAQPPFYRSKAREELAKAIDAIQLPAKTTGEVTVDLYRRVTNKVERADKLKVECIGDELWTVLPLTFDDDNLLNRLYITVPPFEESTGSNIPSACLLKIIYNHQYPSSTVDFLVMLAISTDIKMKMGESFQRTIDTLIHLFVPKVVLHKQRPFAEKREFGYTNALIDFNTAKILDDDGNVNDGFSDWQRIL